MDYNQLELPGMVCHNDKYFLILSTTKLDYIGQPDTEVVKTVRIYNPVIFQILNHGEHSVRAESILSWIVVGMGYMVRS